jgi:hypothetical protein
LADNIELPSGSGGSIVATDDDGTAHHQYVKLEFGADNTQTKVSSANPLPVIAASNSGVDIGDVTINNATGASSVPVQGAAAADAAAAGNPLLAGGRASAAAPTDMSADGDAVPLWTTLKGALNVADGGGSLTVDNAGLTELAAAINASSQVDVNLAASNATVTVDLGVNNDVTVTGTVDLGATDNAVLDAIAASVAAIDTDATTIIGHVDGIEALLGTMDADTGNIATAVQLLDDAVYVDDADWTDSTSKHLLVGGLYQSTPQTVTDGDVAPFNITSTGALHVAQQGTVTVDLGVNNDVTVTGTVDLGATDNAVLDAIAASLALLDNAIPSGNELQVDVVGALPAGTNNIGDVDIASITAGDNVIGRVKLSDGTDVADILDLTNSNPLTVAIVDGDGSQITSFGGGTQYTEDAAAAANPVGTVPILIRKDTPAGVTTTDGDNVAQRGTDYGAAYVQVVDSSGNFVDSFGGSGGTAAADDADFTATSTQGTPAMGVYESTPSSVTDGDMGIVGITQTRALRTAVEGTVAVSNSGLTELAAAINGSSQMDVNIAANGIGLATSAKQDTIIGHVDGIEGLLGTIDTDTGNIVTSVQLLDDTVATLGTDTYTETTTKGLIIGAVRRDADTTLVNTTNEIGPLQMDAAGRLKVEAFSGETLPVSLASLPALAAGTNGIGKLTANSGVDIGDVDVTSISAGTNAIGNVGLIGRTTGGMTIFRSIDIDESEEEVKATAGQVFSITAFNTTAAPLYLKFYNATAANT